MNYEKASGLRARLAPHRERPLQPVHVLLHVADEATRRATARALRGDGYRVNDVASGEAALAQIRDRQTVRTSYELIVIDAATEGVDLLERWGRLGRKWSLPPCVGLVGPNDVASFELADLLGFSWVIEQPVSSLMLRASVHAVAPL